MSTGIFFNTNKRDGASVSLWHQCSGANSSMICASRCAGALPSRLNWMTSCLMYQSKCDLQDNLMNFWWAFLVWLFQSTCVYLLVVVEAAHCSSQADAKTPFRGWANFSSGTRTSGNVRQWCIPFIFLFLVVQMKMWHSFIPYRIFLLWSFAWNFFLPFTPTFSVRVKCGHLLRCDK